jgi:hypothetical protein
MPTPHSVEDILSELRSQRTELNTKLDAINSKLSAVGGKVTILETALPDINKMSRRPAFMVEAEGRILSMENVLTDAMETIAYAKENQASGREQRTWKTGGEGIIVFYSIWAKKKRETCH